LPPNSLLSLPYIPIFTGGKPEISEHTLILTPEKNLRAAGMTTKFIPNSAS
jgi:hypothetical protein